jgi:hypothetical protein
MSTTVPTSTHITAAEPRTWTFTSTVTGEPVTVTCLPGCTRDHALDIATPTHPQDIYCWTDKADDVTLPVESVGVYERRILSTRLEVHPFSTAVAERLPCAVVEVIEEYWIGGLDPEALELVIDTLAERVDAMRRAHAELVAARAEYRRRLA